MREIINFSTTLQSLEQVNPLITKYRINICVPDKPANKFVFNKEVIEGMANTIKGAGVYAYYFNNENQIGGHEDDLVSTKNGYKRTGEPVAYGFADPYKEPYWMEIEGENWYTADVYMWTGRNPHIEEVLDKPVWHSMEVAINNEVDENGNKIVTEAWFLGFCLLQGIDPAFDGSKIEKFSLSNNVKSEIDLLKQEFESLSFGKYDDLDFTIPAGVKKTAQRGLDLRKEYGRGGTSVGLASARYLVKNTKATPEKVRHIAKYFPRHAGDNLDENGKNGKDVSNGYIAWQLWGGNAGRRWSTKLVEAMSKRDEEKLSYFSSDLKVGDSVTWNSSGGKAYGKITKIITDGNVPDIEVKVNGTEDEPAAQIQIYKKVDGEWESTDVLVGHKLDTLNKTEKFSVKNDKEGDNVINEAVEKFSLNSGQIAEIISNALSEYKYGENNWRKYWVNCFDDVYAYVEDCEDSKTYRIKYTILDKIATIDLESKEEVIRGGYETVGNVSNQQSMSEKMEEFCSGMKYTKEEQEMSKYTYMSSDNKYVFAYDYEHEKMMAMPYSMNDDETFSVKTEEAKMAKMMFSAMEEDADDEVFGKMKNIFSSNVYVDNSAMQQLNDNAAKDNDELANQNNPVTDNSEDIIANMKQEMADMKEKMSKLESDLSLYTDENNKLKEFKASIEKQKKDFEVESTLQEVITVLPKEEVENFRKSAENLSVENLDGWKNEVKAKAFSFSSKNLKNDSFVRIGLPFSDNKKSNKGLWD